MALRLYVLLELLMPPACAFPTGRAQALRGDAGRDLPHIRGKRNKDRVVPVNDRARDAVRAYVKTLEPGVWLFPANGEDEASGQARGLRP